MKKLYLIVLIAMLSVATSLNAQTSGTKDCIRLPYAYDFKMYEYSMRISLPENWGFQVPFLNEYDAVLNISKEVDYGFSYYDTINKPVVYYFFIPEKTTPGLSLTVKGYTTISDTSKGLQSEIGNWEKVEFASTEKIESYQQIVAGKLLTFQILAKDEKEKELCRGIIKSCKSYYLESPYDYPYSSAYHSIQYYAKDSTYYPSFGVGFVIDFNAQASIYAKETVINEKTTLLTALLDFTDDIYSEGNTSTFSAEGFDMEYRFLHNGVDTKDLLNGSSRYFRTTAKTFDYVVGGVAAKVSVYGPNVISTIVVEIPLYNCTALFQFNDVTAQNLPKIQKFLSQIYISDFQKEGLLSNQVQTKTLESLAGLKPMGTEKYKLNTKLPSKTKTATCLFTNEGVRVEFPVLGNIMTSSSGDIDVNTKKEIEVEGSYGSYCMTSSESGQTVCYITLNGKEENYKDKVLSSIRTEPLNLEKEGQVNVNGQNWTILTLTDSDGKYYSVYNTTIGEKELNIVVFSFSLDLAEKMEALLSKVTIKK